MPNAPSTGIIFKRCGCRNPESGRQLNGSCPKLRRKGTEAWSAIHGTWYYRLPLPDTEGRKRPEARRGGLKSRQEATQDLNRIQELLAIPDSGNTEGLDKICTLILDTLSAGQPLPDPATVRVRYQRNVDLDPHITVATWLNTWLAGRRTISHSTRSGYEINIRLHLIPFIGHVRLDRLTVGHLDDMFDRIDARNDTILQARTSKDPELRAAFKGRRVIGDASKQRVRATVRAALNHAIRVGILTHNPASYVELPSGKRPKALLWTAERVARWQATGEIPSAVMVWTPAQTGAFLDHAEGDRHYAQFHLIAHRGLRRGESCAVHWADLDLDKAVLTVRWQITQYGSTTLMHTPKSDAGDRHITLDAGTVSVLRDRRRQQLSHRLTHGATWTDTGLVFTEPDGTALTPEDVTNRFRELHEAAGLPPVRLHDLRHGAATLALAAGADLKAVQDLLGHSSIAITADTYTHVLPELAHEIAENVAQLIPRKNTKTSSTNPTSSPHQTAG